MLSLVEVKNYRCLRYISRTLESFHVLVGPNASGKTTFLDVIAFLGDILTNGLERAIHSRANDLNDLTWAGKGDRLEFAVEAAIPAELRQNLTDSAYDTFRYELAMGNDETEQAPCIIQETGILRKPVANETPAQPLLFPESHVPPDTLFLPKHLQSKNVVFSKRPQQDDNYYPETARNGRGGWMPAFKLGPRRSTLANLPEDESKFPVATWFKRMLEGGVQKITLNSLLMRNPSPPGLGNAFLPDGANLPWVVDRLRSKAATSYQDWLAHVRTALPDIDDIDTIERPEDRRRYLVVSYREGFKVPSWLLSDGTLRLLALTLLPYLPDFSGICLIEEPENGIHPRAIETVFQSLSAAYSAQVLLATHSSVILNIAEPSQVLCFAKTADGATDIVRGDEHPALKDWKKEENLGVLFAAGVLG